MDFKKKVGILTFHTARNYGSVLQVYALEHIIKNLGYNCYIVNYVPENQKEMYEIFTKKVSIKAFVKNIYSLLLYKHLKNREKGFSSFIEQHLNLSGEKLYNADSVQKIVNKLDFIICGSDQIWNIRCTDFSSIYYLNFGTQAKKISYAPSMGDGKILFSDAKQREIKNWLTDIDYLSVREQSGKQILSSLTTKNISVVLDPTLLLDKEIWNNLINKSLPYKNYIFFYSIDYNPEAVKIVSKISKIKHMPVVILYTTKLIWHTIGYGFKLSEYETPADFISLIKNAELVLSTSFHGTAFSIIENKQFYVIQGTYNRKINNDDRMMSLINKLHIENRIVNENNIKEIDFSEELNYQTINDTLNCLKQESIDYLKKALDYNQ